MDKYDIGNAFIFIGCATITVAAFMFDWRAGVAAIGLWVLFMGLHVD